MGQTRVFAYIDETGDRGTSAGSSPLFGMAAVIVDESAGMALRQTVSQLRTDFGVPTGAVLSWKNHVKNHDRRKRAAAALGETPGVTVCYVYAEKSALRDGSYRDDRTRFYNYVAGKMYTSVLWAVRAEFGAESQLWTRFGHVRGHDHTTTERYLRDNFLTDDSLPGHLEQGLRWVSADRYAESQAADLYGGFLKAALWPAGEFGYVEPSYLLSVWHQIRNSSACVVPLGIMAMPDYALLRDKDWFPCKPCPKSFG
ncbi:DUF3800 domain-containing protein [Nocardia sp. NPDC058497]|uniref:DUF3800 domain-containing protein n=1 Tax=Nocardia sp. NPDC058497 TaxID=3346529 RepID=UPI003655723F